MNVADTPVALQDAISTSPLLAQLGCSAQSLPGASLPWLQDFRSQGLERFSKLGLPSRKDEAWKYTNLRPLEKVAFTPAVDEEISVERLPSLLPAGASEDRLVFLNGRLRPDLSSRRDVPRGVHLGGLQDILERTPDLLRPHLGQIGKDESHAFLALNTAMMTDGLVLILDPGVALPTPIEVIYISSAKDRALAFHPRNLIALGAGSQAVLIEHHISLGDSPTLSNGTTEIRLEKDAVLHHYKMQAESEAAFHISNLFADLDASAHYDSFGMSLGARLSRNEVKVRLEGEGAHCHVNGAYMMRGKQHYDSTTVIDHLVPGTSCREVFKGVLDDQARGVFQGRIVVHPGAQGTDGHQLSKTMLLSEKAEIDAKPELEIYADDVKCSHGATAGELDHDALFYLRARGIPDRRARNMLIEAFLSETVDAIAAEDLCPAFLASIADWLRAPEEELAA